MGELSPDDRRRMTAWQLDQLEEDRDCPHCSETMQRVKVAVKSHTVTEHYEHSGADCPGYHPNSGRRAPWGGWVEHWEEGQSHGTHVFEGEFA